MKSRKEKAAKPAFTCTEYHGTADINDLIVEPIVDFINESFGREIVVARDPEPELAVIVEMPIENTNPPERPRKKKSPRDEIPIAQ